MSSPIATEGFGGFSTLAAPQTKLQAPS